MKLPFLLMHFFLVGMSTALTAEPPHIGYIYPAGGKRGTTFEASIGGQYLEGTSDIIVTDEGVQVQVIDYAVRYDVREMRRLYRRKENLEATIKERKEKGEAFDQEERQLEQILHHLSVAELPNGVEVANKRQALRSYRGDTKEQFNPQIAERLRLRITLDPQAASGERELRIRTPSGLSNPLFFEVGSLAESCEQEPNDDHMGPNLQVVPVPGIINGQVRPGDMDHFRFDAARGERIVVSVSARRIIPYLADAVPGWFQAVVALYDSDGNEVAYDDDYKLNPDPVLFFEVPESGTYTLSIRDSIYRGREDFVYRIAIGELPFITAIFPLGGRQGENVDIRLSGWNLPQNRISGTLPYNDGSIRRLSVRKDGYRSNEMPFAIEQLPEATETEPNNSADQAQAVSLPLTVNGRIQQAGDRDVYRFEGKQGDMVSIRIQARRLNSPLDSILTLSGPGLEPAVRSDDYMPKDVHLHLGAGLVTHHADSYLLQELPQTGTYVVEVGDTQSKGGPDYAYRVRISPAQPDFQLRMEPSGLQLAPGSTAVFTIHANRAEGFNKAIAITATNLPAGFKMSHADIAADDNLTRVTITAPSEMEATTIFPAICGTAIIDGTTVTHNAVPVDDQMQAFLYRHLVPAKELVLTSTAEPPPIALEVRNTGIIELPLGEEVRVPLRGFVHTQRQGTKVAIDQPPAGIIVVKGWIGRRKDAGADNPLAFGNLFIKAEAPLQPGDRITLIPVAIIKQGQEETRYPAPAITLEVTAPL